jgi:hypothetical protein
MNVGKEYYRQQSYETVAVHARDYYCPTTTFIFYENSVEVYHHIQWKAYIRLFFLVLAVLLGDKDTSVGYRCASD